MDLDAGTPSAESALERLGLTLREARLARGMECRALAAQLRMGPEQLEALEAGDFSRLPEMVFVIAQARRVADALGVDVNLLITPLKQSAGALKPAPAPLTADTYSSKSSHNRGSQASLLPVVGWVAVLAGLAAAGGWGWQQLNQAGGKPMAPAPLVPVQPAPQPGPSKPVATPAGLRLTSAEASWLEVRTSSGKQLFEGNLKGTRIFPLGTGLKVLAGRPDLVRASLGDAPGKTLGRIDQLTWVEFKPSAPAAAAPTP
jgi:cytoskeletal protein RodZ